MIDDAPRPAPRAPVTGLEALGWLGAVALLLVMRLRILDVPLERDEGLFAVIGWAILGGAVPYRDVFEHKPPGVFYVYALAVAVAPPTARGLHAFLALWCVATGLVVVGLARALAGPTAGLAAVLVFALLSAAPSIQGFSASSEMLLLLPLAGCVWLALLAGTAPDQRRASVLAGASGALAGVTFWIKQPAALALAAVPALLIAERPRSAIALPAAWAAGAIAASLLVVPLVVAAGWSEFWYWTVVHSSLYAAVPATDQWARVAASVRNVAADFGHVLLVGVVGSAVAWRRGRQRAPFAIAFLLLSVASAFHSPFLYRHYFALVLPAAAAVGGAGFAWLADAWLRERGAAGRAAAIATAGALLIALPFGTHPRYWLHPEPVAVIRDALGDQGFEAAPLLAAYVRERTRPSDRIFVYGSEPEIAFLGERKDVNPFVMAYPLTWHWPRHREFQERVWAAIEHDPPAYILLPRTRFSLVKSPLMDPFLETRLAELGAREYQLAAVLVRDANGRFDLRPEARDPFTGARAEVFCEIWHRRGASAP